MFIREQCVPNTMIVSSSGSSGEQSLVQEITSHEMVSALLVLSQIDKESN